MQYSTIMDIEFVSANNFSFIVSEHNKNELMIYQ
jgi:hypothetical protein